MLFIFKHTFNIRTALVLLLFLSFCRNPETIQLKDFEGKDFSLKATGEYKGTAFIFFAPQCPLSENYTLVLNNLQADYTKNDIHFYAVIPGVLYSHEEIKAFIDSFRIQTPVLLDPEKKLTRHFRAGITPEVFLINHKQELLYSGAIDNWAIGLTQLRSEATKQYLRDAIESYLNNRTILIKNTEAIGCIIE